MLICLKLDCESVDKGYLHLEVNLATQVLKVQITGTLARLFGEIFSKGAGTFFLKKSIKNYRGVAMDVVTHTFRFFKFTPCTEKNYMSLVLPLSNYL